MHVMERILLYTIALIVGLRLLMPTGGETAGSEIDRPPPEAGIAALRGAGNSDLGTSAASERALTLVDAAGQSRILLSVADDGTPSIMLRSPSGKVAMRLAVEADETTIVELGEGDSRTTLQQEADGASHLEMRSGEGTVAVGIDRNGETSLSLNRTEGRLHAKLALTDKQEAQLHIGPEGSGGGVTVGWNPEGDAYLSVLQADGKTGPVMQSFKDGLAQVAINAAAGDAGPVDADDSRWSVDHVRPVTKRTSRCQHSGIEGRTLGRRRIESGWQKASGNAGVRERRADHPNHRSGRVTRRRRKQAER